MTLLTLLRKQFRDSRWSLALCTLAFLGLALLMAWRTSVIEEQIASGALTRNARRGLRFLQFMGGPEMDFSSLAILVCWWNHPFVVLTVLGWSVARGSASVAGEIERGTLDLTLSRPVSRVEYLAAQVLFALLGLAMMVGGLVAGTLIGELFFTLKTPPTPWQLLRPAGIVVALGAAVFGYTVPFSAVDSVRWRPGLVAMAATLGGLVAMSLAPQFEGYDWLEKLSVFRAYAPVTIAVTGEPLAYNGGVLMAVFAAGTLLAFIAFSRRDLPASGG